MKVSKKTMLTFGGGMERLAAEEGGKLETKQQQQKGP